MRWKCFVNYILHDVIKFIGFIMIIVIPSLITVGVIYLISWFMSLFGVILLPETIIAYGFGLVLLVVILGMIIIYFYDVYLKCKL